MLTFLILILLPPFLPLMMTVNIVLILAVIVVLQMLSFQNTAEDSLADHLQSALSAANGIGGREESKRHGSITPQALALGIGRVLRLNLVVGEEHGVVLEPGEEAHVDVAIGVLLCDLFLLQLLWVRRFD